jgi:iron complex transport system ATP-binding protein
VLAVVHDLTLAATFADRIALMSQGRLIIDGAPDEVLEPGVLRDVYGVRTLVLRHPTTGRPIVVPEGTSAITQHEVLAEVAP